MEMAITAIQFIGAKGSKCAGETIATATVNGDKILNDPDICGFKSSYIGPHRDSEFLIWLQVLNFFRHCNVIRDDDITNLVVETYPKTISRFQTCLLDEDLAKDIRLYLFDFKSCTCKDCINVK
jgi:hypothetical protein